MTSLPSTNQDASDVKIGLRPAFEQILVNGSLLSHLRSIRLRAHAREVAGRHLDAQISDSLRAAVDFTDRTYVRCSCVLRRASRTQKTACRILRRCFTPTRRGQLLFQPQNDVPLGTSAIRRNVKCHSLLCREGVVRAGLGWPQPRCRRFDGAAAEVSFTSCSSTNSKLAEV